MSAAAAESLPAWSWTVPLAASLLLVLKFAHILPSTSALVLVAAAILLGGAVFAAVHHAEILALRLGEPFGSILLAVAVTVIEVALIVSIMISGGLGADTVARDTVFSAVMIVLNGVVGLCIVMGATRHHEQSFQIQGASSTLAVLGTLAVLALVMPNFTVATRGGDYAPVQLIVVGAVSLILYMVFVFVQTVRHRAYFLDVAADPGASLHAGDVPPARMAAASLGLLLVSLVAVVLLAKTLSVPLSDAVQAAGLPHAVVGVVIAAVVLLPEGMASLKAALANRLQSSINLALGSAVASIGLTIPVVAIVAVASDQRLILGLADEHMVLLVLTLFVSTLTLGTGRTTVLQGAVHLVLFSVFLLLSVVP
jgi:Ca2+:H+ antiporter